MKSDSWASWKAAQELPDREDHEPEEIKDWSNCKKHGKFPTEAMEVFGRDPKHPERMGMTICPLCYDEIMKSEKGMNE